MLWYWRKKVSKKAVVFTLGCKVNSYESAMIGAGLQELGYEVSDKLAYADLYVLNTCAVTMEAEKKSRQLIARVKKFNPLAEIIVTGCASEKNGKVFFEKQGVKLVTGAKSKEKILAYLKEGVGGINIEQVDEYASCDFLPLHEKSRAFVKIQDGCNNFCSYCIIPYLRGRSRSRNIDEAVKEIVNVNANEVVITGIDISSYCFNGNRLSDLIFRLIGEDKRIRLGSLEVGVIDEKLLDNLKQLKKFSPQFHLSLQSGSNNVLKSMNRHYTTEEYYKKVQLIRTYFPFASLTTDVIAGYSTESESDFEETLAFCKKVGFADIHCFPYSPRSGTTGAKLKELPNEVKKARMDKLLELKEECKKNYYELCKDKSLTFIFEDFDGEYSYGTTDNYIKCKVKGKIETESKIKLTAYAEMCEAEKI